MAARIGIVNPNPPRQRGGNRTTALRWTRFFRDLGHRVFIEEAWSGRECDLLVALNAWKAANSIERFCSTRPRRPIVVALTGTDLYTEGAAPGVVDRSLDAATRIIVLQELALDRLQEEHRNKTIVVHQSVQPLTERPVRRTDAFDACVVANLRPVKDPLLAARAARLVSPESRLHVHLVGEALEEDLRAQVERENAENPRFRWWGRRTRRETLGLIAGSHVLVSTSVAEGGAGTVSEAIAHDVPVLSTDIEGARGMFPPGYPGFYPVGDAAALAALLERTEQDAEFLAELRAQGARRAWITDPNLERVAWRDLLAALLPAT